MPSGILSRLLTCQPAPSSSRITVLGMKHGQGKRRITLLLSDRRQDVNAAVSDLDSCRADTALAVANLDMVLTGDRHVLHLVGVLMFSVPRQPVDTASD